MRGSAAAPRRPAKPVRPDEVPAPPSTRALLGRWEGRAAELQAKLEQYVALLLTANSQFNLTADRTPVAQWLRHVDDALACAAILENSAARPKPGIRILDVGSGGGMPAIVWAILWPEAEFTLVEATWKKADFLERAARALDLKNVKVVNERAELVAHAKDQREKYDLVSARALGALPTLAELTVPFLRVGGVVAAIKGARIDEELKAAKRALKVLGAQERSELAPYTRPDGKECALLLFRKTARTPSTYPRRVGLPEDQPL